HRPRVKPRQRQSVHALKTRVSTGKRMLTCAVGEANDHNMSYFARFTAVVLTSASPVARGNPTASRL
ncbi:MAG: hypothetical protein AABZ02_02340, partial [Bacteroidota bacterium]